MVTMLLLHLSIYGQVSISANTNAGCSPLPVVISVDTPDAAAITTYAWTVTFPSGTVVNSSDSQYIGVFSQPGEYDVQITINGNLSTTETAFITVYAPPVAAIAVDDGEGCVPHCVQFSDASTSGGGTIVEWAWDFGNGNLSTLQNPDFCYQTPGSYTPVLSVEDEFGCFSSTSAPQLVTVSNTPPVAAFVPSTFNDCNPPSEITFTNTSQGDGLISDWDFGNGFTQSAAGTGEVTQVFTLEGDYEVCLSVENNIGCEATVCETISIVTPPAPQFSASANEICAGNYIDFTNLTSPAPSSLSWDFDGDGVEDASGTEVSFNFGQEGVYNPVLTAVYSGNCIGTSDGSFNIEVFPALETALSASVTSACSVPQSITLQNESQTPGIVSLEWLLDGVSQGFGESLEVNLDAFGSYDVSLVATTALCTDTLTLADYIQLQSPTIDFSLPAQICTGVEVPVNGISINSPEDVVDIEWDFDGDGIVDATGDDPNYSYTDPGVYTVQVFLVTVNGCTSTVSADQTIIVQPDVAADFTSSAQITCAGDEVTFCTDMLQNTTYAWNFGGPWFNVSLPNECINYTFPDTGYFDVTLSVSNTACNAILTLEDYIYVVPPVAEFEFVQDCLDPNQVAFTDVSIEADQLIWDFGDGSPLVFDELNPIHTYPQAGTYQVTLIAVNDETGCQDDYTATVITTTDPVPLTASQAIGCAPVTPNFNSSANTQFVFWDIDFGNGTTATVELTAGNIWSVNVFYNTGEVDSYTNSFTVNWWPDVPYTEGGSYDVTVTATDNSGCVTTTVHEDMVTVYNDLEFAGFNANIIEGCDSVLIEFQPTGNFLAQGTWEFSDGTTSTELNPTHQFFPPWDYAFAATFTVTDDFGCGSSASDTIDLVPPPVPGFTTTSDPSCIAEALSVTNTSTGDIVGHFWDFGNPGNPQNTSTEEAPEFSYTENGTYTICLTAENSQGCQQTLCQDNAVNIISPVAEIGLTPQINNCLFGVQFENLTEGDTFCSDWSFGDGQFGSGNDPYHTYSIGVYDVELVVCNEFGCYDTTTVFDIFNLSNVIGPFSTVLDQVDCAPFQVDFQAYNQLDQSFTYFWDFGDGSGDPDNNTLTDHSYMTPGTYCPTLVMQDPNGCTFLLECEEPIVVTEFTFELGSVEPVCFGESSVFTANGAESYTFSHPEYVTDLGAGQFEVEAPESTEVLVTGQFSDCQQTQSLEVVVYPLPEVTLELPEGVCFEEPVFALTGGWPEGQLGVYSLDGAEIDSFDPSMDAGQIYEVVYGFTDENTCFNSDTASIEIYPLPLVSLEAFADMCENDEVLELAGGSPLGGSYSVDDDEMQVFDASAGYGEYNVTYAYTDPNGCSAQASEWLQVFPSPHPAVTPPSLCWQESLTLNSDATVAEGEVVDYVWDFGANGTQTGSATAVIETDGPTTLDLTFTVITDAGCSADTSLQVPIYPSPTAAFSVDDICEGEAIGVNENSNVENAIIEDWQWLLDGEVLSNDQDLSFVPEGWGNFTLELVVTTMEGCTDETNASFTVAPLPVLEFEVEDACTGEEVQVTNDSFMPDGSSFEQLWQDNQGLSFNGSLPSFEYANHGEVTLVLSAISEAGCSAETEAIFNIFATPEADFTWDETFFCAEGSASLLDVSSIAEGAITQWSWSADGQVFGNGPQADFSSDEPGAFSISLEVISDQGCFAAISYPNLLEFWPIPSANFSYAPQEPDNATPYVFVSDLSLGGTEVEYEVSDGGWYDTPDFQHEFAGIGSYTLTQVVSNEFGCTDTLTVEIEVAPVLTVYVPNAFTPDGDGLNEVFRPVIAGLNISDYRFIVLNRWGELVFESENPTEGWLGNMRGGEHYVPGGAYVWQLQVRTEETRLPEVFTGHVMVLR